MYNNILQFTKIRHSNYNILSLTLNYYEIVVTKQNYVRNKKKYFFVLTYEL